MYLIPICSFASIHKTFRTILTFNIHHGDFHNILLFVVASLLIAGVLKHFGIRFFDALLCAAIGIAAHFFEDALVYKTAYATLWPLSSQKFGIGIMRESPRMLNVFGIANSTVLTVGLILLIGALLVRMYVEGTGWWRVFLPGGRRSGNTQNDPDVEWHEGEAEAHIVLPVLFVRWSGENYEKR